jgi:hypothetical protein
MHKLAVLAITLALTSLLLLNQNGQKKSTSELF